MTLLTTQLTSLIKKWRGYLADAGMEEESKLEDAYFKGANYASRNPELLDRLHEDPMFSHVDVFVYPIIDPEALEKYRKDLAKHESIIAAGGKASEPRMPISTRQRAALYGLNNVVKVVAQSFPDINITVPQSLEQRRGMNVGM